MFIANASKLMPSFTSSIAKLNTKPDPDVKFIALTVLVLSDASRVLWSTFSLSSVSRSFVGVLKLNLKSLPELNIADFLTKLDFFPSSVDEDLNLICLETENIRIFTQNVDVRGTVHCLT